MIFILKAKKDTRGPAFVILNEVKDPVGQSQRLCEISLDASLRSA
jgi:hypothetical protein